MRACMPVRFRTDARKGKDGWKARRLCLDCAFTAAHTVTSVWIIEG